MSSSLQDRYRELYSIQQDQRLYAAPWWLDATCGEDGWSAVSFENDAGQWMMPYYHPRIRKLSAAITPPLTQWVDILHDGGQDDTAITQLLKQLPRVSITDISLRPGIQIIPEVVFRTSSQYSYVLPPASTADAVLARYNDSMRYMIRHATDALSIDRTPDIEKLTELYAAVYRQKKLPEPWWIRDVLPRLAKTLLDRGNAEMRFARRNNEIIAGSLVAHDSNHDYYLVGGRMANESGMSAHAWLLHDAIVTAGARGHDFDFEGSMVAGIASFFQSFGARPLPFQRVRRYRGLGKLWALIK